MSWSFPEKPFIGLRPFTKDDNLLLFGRRQQAQELLRRLHDHRFLAIIGSSGSGKSSLVRAGLVPQLEGGFMVSERDAWIVATMKPGDAPIRRLAEELVAATGVSDTEQADVLAEAIESQGLQAILDFVKPRLQTKSANLLLVVDQFEEIFRFNLFSKNPEKVEIVSEFVALLIGLVRQNEIPVYVTLTMRSDFLGDCDFFNGLPEALNESQYLVPRLSREQRREVIEGPIKLFKGKIAPRLVDRLLNETGEARDDLPILQHALLRTWDEAQRQGTNALDIQHYQAIGTIKDALKLHAEEALNLKDERGMKLTMKVFQTLTELDASNRAVRRPAKMAELVAVSGGKPAEIKEIIDRFKADGRLFLVEYKSDDVSNPLIDISHESLIRQWDRLAQWVLDDAEAASDYIRIARRVKLNQEGKEELYSGRALELALEWQKQVNPSSEWAARHVSEVALKDVQSFLDESIRASRNSRLIKSASILSLFGILIALAFVFSLGSKNDQLNDLVDHLGLARDSAVANQRHANYNMAQLYGQKARNAREESRYSETWLYALKGLTEDIDTRNARFLPLSMGALMAPEVQPSSQWTNGVLPTLSPVTDVAYSPDGRFAGLGFVDGRVRIFDFNPENNADSEILLWPPFRQITNQTLRTDGLTSAMQNCLGRKRGFLFPDMLSSFTTGIANQMTQCGITGERLRAAVVENAPRFHERYVWDIAYSADGNLLASAAPDNSLFLWELYTDADGKKQGRLKHFLYVADRSAKVLAFHPEADSLLIAGYDDGILRIWDLNLDNESAKPEIIKEIQTGAPSVTSLAFDPVSLNLAVGLNNGKIGLLANRQSELTFFPDAVSHRNVVTDLGFSPDGERLVSASRDYTIRLWSVADMDRIGEPMQGHVGAVSTISYDPLGKILISGAEDQTIRYWDVDTQLEIARIYHQTPISAVAFNPDGKNILFGSETNQLNSLRTTVKPFDDESLTLDIRTIGVNPFSKENRQKLDSVYRSSTTRLPYELRGIDFMPRGVQRITDEDASAGEGIQESSVLAFSNANNRGFPVFNATETILIEEGRKGAAQALFFKENYRPPFEVSFEYSIYNEEVGGWYDYSKLPADGLVLMLLKDKTPYEFQSIPGGNAQAFIAGSGYGIHFYVFEGGGDTEHISIRRRGRELVRWPEEGVRPDSSQSVYTAGQWRQITVQVLPNSIQVQVEGEVVMQWKGTLSRSYGGLGFGASTGDADAEHKIRNVVAKKLE